jgi:rifampicin phosphotransferase
MPYIAPFRQLNQNNIPIAGGKGANLGELITADFPVPPGFVLTTSAYDTFVHTHSLQQQIMALANSVAADNPQSSEAAAAQIRQLFLAAEIPAEIALEVAAAWQNLGHTAVAVRSSATAEDLPGASFAGQQDTYLNIQDEEALLAAVKNCWASLWTARAIAYRLRQGIDPATVSLAVVVQQLIPADAAGILFTADPVSGERDQIVINATWGLGEAIVGGLVTPDTVIVDKQNWGIVWRETAIKTTMTVRTESGTEEQLIPQERQHVPVLDDGMAVQLAQLGAQIETHYDMPMDIEWAVAGEEIAILQARPITSLPPAPLKNVSWKPIFPDSIWMRRQIVEHMPAPLSPLFEDLYLKQGMDQSTKYLMEEMGKVTDVYLNFDNMVPYGFAGTINGYAYTSGSFRMDWENLVAVLKIYSRIFRFFDMALFDWEGVALPQYQALIARWDAIDLDEAADEELLQGIREMAAADSTYWFGSAMNLSLSRMLDSVFDRLLKSFFIGQALPKPGLGSSAFLRGFDSKALDAQAHMEHLANTLRASTTLRELVRSTPAERLITTLAVHPEGQAVVDGIHHYLDEYGHQIYNLDFVDPTQSEEPLPMLLSLKALVENPPAQDVRTRQSKMAEERDALVAQTAQALNPLSRRLFQWLWRWTKQYAPYREHVMFYMGAAWPTLRNLAHTLGQRLTDAGTLAQPDDIYYLDNSEIAAAIEARAGRESLPGYAQLTQERRELREARKQLTPPAKVPESASLKVGPIDLSMFDPTPNTVVNSGPVLHGYAVSTGSVTAPASVIHSVKEFDQMQPGTILVCTTTTPAWTPLFSQAVGLVTDVGGALAHGSIVAREYGIPAVMGTGMATERIQSGMMLTVDGDKGMVKLLDEVDLQEEARIAEEQMAEKKAAKQRKMLVGLVLGFVLGLIWWKRRKRVL